MANVHEAQDILETLGLPKAQQNEMAALTLIALCALEPSQPWSAAKRERRTVTKGIMDFVKTAYGKVYAPNTRETFRRQVLHQFVQGHIADYNAFEPDLPTNSPRAHYAVTTEALAVIKTYGTPKWKAAAKKFIAEQGTLNELYSGRRDKTKIPVTLPNGDTIRLSPGKHNKVQKAIVEEFAARFAPGAELLYLGDTEKKGLIVEEEGLTEVGLPTFDHNKLPDVVLFDRKRKWLFLIEAVTSHGPISPKRMVEFESLLAKSKVGVVFVTAFPDMTEFKKYARDIAWETEVWLADVPDHLIHFNGDRFYGPRNRH